MVHTVYKFMFSVQVYMCTCRSFLCTCTSCTRTIVQYNYWHFHADIDDDLLVSDQGIHSRRAYGGCLLETSYMYALLIH